MSAAGKLMKDLVMAAAGFGLMYVICAIGGTVDSSDLFGCFLCSGILFGWRWANSLIPVYSLYALALKVILAVVLGLVAMPVTLIRDLIAVFRG